MGPRAKGQTLDVFNSADDITDLTVEHDRDNRQNQMYGQGNRPRGGGMRSGEMRGDGDDWGKRRPRREEMDVDVDDNNWRSSRPAATSGSGGFQKTLSRPMERSMDRSVEITRSAPSAPTGPKKIQFGAILNPIKEANTDAAPALEQARKNLEQAPTPVVPTSAAIPAPSATTAPRGGRFGGLMADDDNERSRPKQTRRDGDAAGPRGEYASRSEYASRGQTQLKRAAEEEARRQAALEAQKQREAEAKQRALEAERRENEARLKAQQEEEERERLAKVAEEKKKREEVEKERKAFVANMNNGRLLVGSPDDIRKLANIVGKVLNGESEAESLSTELSADLRKSSLPVAVVFAMYLRKLLDVCEEISEESKTEEEADNQIASQLVPLAEQLAVICKKLTTVLADETALAANDFAVVKMQELARISATAGLARMTSTYSLVSIVFESLYKEGAITRDELLNWSNSSGDKCEKRTDALARVVNLIRSLKGYEQAGEEEDIEVDEDEAF